jgi:hypothetical protein
MKNSVEVRQSFPILGILGIVFVTLKLCGVINWSWWWVLLPFYGPLALALVLLVLCSGLLGIINLKKGR